MEVLISACLLGLKCRYDGGGKALPPLAELLGRADLSFVPVCPEQLGGLPTPRPPAERVGERVRTRDGGDVTEQYARGAAQAEELARLTGCRCALLKARSPSCGSGVIYDGTFTGARVSGDGLAAAALRERGVALFTEEEEEALWRFLNAGAET